MSFKKGYIPLLLVIVGLSGCKGKKKTQEQKSKTQVVATSVDIPLAGDTLQVSEEQTVRSFFDDNAQELVLTTDGATDAANANQSDELAWIEATTPAAEKSFEVVYFDFDKSTVRDDQQVHVQADIKEAKKALAAARKDGVEPTIVIEGHSCHSAGSSAYNIALSEKRAKAVLDWFVGENVPRENIKIVGRGSEMPATINGKVVDGSREEQWANRRVEVHIIHA